MSAADNELTRAFADVGIEVTEEDDLRRFLRPDGSVNRLAIGKFAMDAKIRDRSPKGGFNTTDLYNQAIESTRRNQGGAA